MKRRVLSAIMAALLLVSLPMTVLADEWYLEDGDISVSATSNDGGATQTQTVTQGSTTKTDSAPVITQRDSTKTTQNTVTISSSGGATAEVTIKDVNVEISEADSAVDVTDNSTAVITVSGDNHIVQAIDWEYADNAVIRVGDNANLTLQGDGKSRLEAFTDGDGAVIGSNENEVFTGSITMKDLTFVGTNDDEGAVIGAGDGGDFEGNIHIQNSDVTATADDACAIGGSESDATQGSKITIQDSTLRINIDHEPAIGADDSWDFDGTIELSGNTTIITDGMLGGSQEDYLNNGYGTIIVKDGGGNDVRFYGTDGEPRNVEDMILGSNLEIIRVAEKETEVDNFWRSVVNSLRKAESGSTVTVDAAWRTTMPASVMEAIAETGVTLIIQWDGGEDITIDKPYDGEEQYTVFKLKELAQLLKK